MTPIPSPRNLLNRFAAVILGIISTLVSLTACIYATSIELPTHQLSPRFIAQISSENFAQRRIEKSMHPEEIRLIIQQAGDAWVAGDADAFAKLFTPDGELIVHGKRWVGPANIQEAAARFAQAYSVKIDIKRIIVEGNQAVVEWFWEELEKVTGKRSQADDAIVIDFKNGQICRWREYIDTDTPAQTNSQ